MTEPAYLQATRAAYDTVAADYADLLRTELASKPLDRALLGTFAEIVLGDAGDGGRTGDSGRTEGSARTVADVGCGPGRVTTHLHDLGLNAFGIDLSPGMIDVARTTYPHLRFDVGSMTALDLPDGELDGIVAWYSIIHLPRELLPTVFAEFARVLRPAGQLLLAFQVGDEIRHLDNAYGHDISLDAYRQSPEHLTGLLSDAGFDVHTQVLREPEEWESTNQGYLMARNASTTPA